MINAIGIYATDDECCITKKIEYVPKDRIGFFKPLDSLEKSSLPSLARKFTEHSLAENFIYYQNQDGEHHYFIKLKDENIVIAIATKKAFNPEEFGTKELNNLFSNINAVRLGNGKGISLDEIKLNWVNYTAKELVFININGKIQAHLDLVRENIKLGLGNIQTASVCEEKSKVVLEQAELFKATGKRMNSCC